MIRIVGVWRIDDTYFVLRFKCFQSLKLIIMRCPLLHRGWDKIGYLTYSVLKVNEHEDKIMCSSYSVYVHMYMCMLECVCLFIHICGVRA